MIGIMILLILINDYIIYKYIKSKIDSKIDNVIEKIENVNNIVSMHGKLIDGFNKDSITKNLKGLL